MTSKTKLVVALLALVVVGGVAAYLAVSASGPAATVQSAVATEEDLALTITAAGRVESGVRADVFPPTAGTLSDVLVEDGDEVKAGAVLARLDTGPLELQVVQARSALAGAEAQLAAVNKQAPSGDDLAAARAGTDAAWKAYQAALAATGSGAPAAVDIQAAAAARQAAYTGYSLAKASFDALAASIEASAIPSPVALAELETLRLAKEQAYAGYLQAKAAEEKLLSYDGSAVSAQSDAAANQAYAAYLNARAAQARLEGTDLSAECRAAQAAVDQARAALVLAEENLAGASLTSPIDGVVLFNPAGTPASDGAVPTAAKGSAVGPQSAPFTVVDLEGMRFVAEVDEIDIDRVDLGLPAVVALDAFTDRDFLTEVTRISPAAQLTATGGTAFPVDLVLDRAQADVLIGMRGDAEIEVSSVPGALTLPVEALFDEGGTTYVYVISDGVLVRTQVEVGTITETRVQIVSGIDPGAEVALSGPVELVDEMRVEVER